jgi:hypothetical protein
MTMDKRKTFEGLVLRALHTLLQVVCRYNGEKTNEIVAERKADAREYLREPWEPSEREIAAAEIVEYHEGTLAQARRDGNL